MSMWRRSPRLALSLARGARRSNARALSSSAQAVVEETPFVHPPVTSLYEEEAMLRDAVTRFAREEVAPLVRQMDDSAQMDPAVIKGLFSHGAKFFSKAAEDKRSLAEILIQYQNRRGGKVVFQAISRPSNMTWDSPLAAFQEALEQEKTVRDKDTFN